MVKLVPHKLMEITVGLLVFPISEVEANAKPSKENAHCSQCVVCYSQRKNNSINLNSDWWTFISC